MRATRLLTVAVAVAAAVTVPIVEAQEQSPPPAERVEVEAERTETTTVFANPDGSMTVESSARPVRVRQGGQWTPVDTTLRFNPDGSVSPVATAAALVFSGGGDEPLARISDADRSWGLTWPGPLPRPLLHGDTATYGEVLPGVDLRVRAGVEGFSEVLVVKNAQAAANPALAQIRLGTVLEGVTLTSGPDGVVSAVDAAGAKVFGTGQALMWDSSAAPGEGAQPGSAMTPGGRVATLPVEVSGDALTVTPPQDSLADAGTTYPLFIDPSVSITRSAWTMINQRFPDQSYWDRDRLDGAKAGYVEDHASGWVRYRSLFGFPVSTLHGKNVLSSTFSIDLIHTWLCSAARTDLYLLNPLSPQTTWNNHAWGWIAANNLANNSVHSCNDVRKPTEFGSVALANKVQTAADQRAPVVTLGLKAFDESNHNGWKKFDPNTAKLTVTYNSYPNKPDLLKSNGKACVRGVNRPHLPTKTPTLQARVSDPDRGPLTATFTWAQIEANGTYRQLGSVARANHPSGSTASFTVPALADGGNYAWRVQAKDSIDSGAASDWCEFTVDATPPAAPKAVVSPEYPADGELHGGVGRFGTFTITAPDDRPGDVAAYRYATGLCDQPSCAKEVPVTAADRSAQITYTPTLDGITTMLVWASDKAGNYSKLDAPLTYVFSVRPPSAPNAQWLLDENSGTTAGDSSGNGHTATVDSGATWVAGRLGTGAALRFDDTAGASAHTAGPAVRTDGSFTVSSWVRLTKTGKAFTAVSQDGSRSSAFVLQYGADGKWAFRLRGADDDNPAVAAAVAPAAPQIGVWTHLTGVYDAGVKQVRLYVNGRPAGSAAVPFTPWNATEALSLGRSKSAGTMTEHWAGDLDEARVWDRVVLESQIAGLAEVPVLAGRWELDEGSGTVAVDSAEVRPQHVGTLTGGTSWSEVDVAHARPDGGRPDADMVATFNGTTGQMTTAGPVLRTDQSFTVAAWVRMTNNTTYRGVMAQQGSRGSAFFLQYDWSSKRWAMGGSSADVNNPALPRALSTSVPQVGKWTHLVGVYDATERRLKLYVNGVLEGSTAHTAWQANGPIVLGSSKYNGAQNTFWAGDLAGVRAYGGVVSDSDIRTLAGI